MENQTNLLAYYKNSEVRVTNERHPHYNAIGEVKAAEGIMLKIVRFDTKEDFFANSTDLKIVKRR